ncbi:MAG: DNA-3-methyladenine glycosylase, partial [Parcubacteria group bacterium]|nr:DNA-3-methyladenine glycosylase [Parcubacteria group bacterium]
MMITETESYDGSQDRASHAHKGKTPRTEIMFGPAGHFYIYLCYGMYYMLNVVVGPKEYPAAVLIRSAKLWTSDVQSLDGPGKLTKFLKIDKKLN